MRIFPLNKTMSRSLFFSLVFFIFSQSWAQGLNKNQLNDLIWEKVEKNSLLSFKELTSGGDFSGCELTYSYPYRDYRARNGEPVIVNGSITSSYVKGKVLSLMLKLQPQVIDLTSKPAKMVTAEPNQATFKVKDINFDKYRLTKFTCEQGGYCAAYGSPNQIKFMEDVFAVVPFNPVIYFNLSKNGVDEKFSLITLKGNEKHSELLLGDFSQCLVKVVELQVKGMPAK